MVVLLGELPGWLLAFWLIIVIFSMSNEQYLINYLGIENRVICSIGCFVRISSLMLIFISAVTVALVVSFLCSIFESVLLSINHAQIQGLVQQGKLSGRLLNRFKRHIDVPIAAILIVNTIAHTIGASVAGASYSQVFDPATLWIFTIVFTIAVLLFTEIIPKTLGVTHAGSLAGPVAIGINLLVTVLRPLIFLSEKISRAIRGNKEAPVTSVEEIRLLAALGRNEGVVGFGTAQMIEGATQLKNLTVHDVLLPRGEVKFLSNDLNRDQAIVIVRDSGHSRFPFCEGDNLDKISGVVLAKELMNWMLVNDTADIPWPKLVREPLVVPETMTVPILLKTFQESRRHLAVVVDEYGDVQGIVTLEDVLEELVGEIVDEYDRPTTDIRSLKNGSILVAGDLDLRRLSRHLGIDWEPEGEAATVSGLLMESLERLPDVGDRVAWRGYSLEVRRMAKDRPAPSVVFIEVGSPEDDEANESG